MKNTEKLDSVNIGWLIDAYSKTPKTEQFFGSTFTIHAGNTFLEKQLKQGISAKQIQASWQKDIQEFKSIRNKYLIYN